MMHKVEASFDDGPMVIAVRAGPGDIRRRIVRTARARRDDSAARCKNAAGIRSWPHHRRGERPYPVLPAGIAASKSWRLEARRYDLQDSTQVARRYPRAAR